VESLGQMVNRINAQRERDAQRYETQDFDLCQVCHAYGPDKRSLTIDCFYQLNESIPEFIDLFKVEGRSRDGYYMRICQSCRGRLIAHLQEWFKAGKALRDTPKDHDGGIDYDGDPDANIPIRINGATVMFTREQYDAYKEKHDAQA